ncbi:MAG: methyltransferase domain-containing protein, partial [Myxococcota bacterium]
MKFEKDYYENIEIWTREPADYQRDILEEIQKIIPEDVKSILDAGCGNGVICNNLKDGYDITACDISETALSFVRTGKRFVASIDNLPFEDSSFDLVMVNDVLEHLDTERFMRAIDEIKRVSRKYIILSVPFMENLLFNYARCKKCGGEFHTNLHKRSFELKDFLNLFVGFSVRLSVFAGEIYQSTITPFVKYRHIFNEFISDTDTTCPFCGAENRKDIAKSRHFVERINDILEYSFLNRNYQLWKRRPDRLEILLLYVRDGIDFQPQKISVSGESSILSTNELHFSPTFLISELKPFYPYPQFSILRGRYNFEEDGLRLAGEDIGIRFSLPLNILPDSKIEIEIRVNSESELNIMAYDPVFDRYKLLGNLSLNSDSNNLNISISEAILPSRYGVLFEINIMGDVILKSLKVSGSNSEQNFEIINSNNGYLFKEIDGINFLYKTEKDRLIKPEWFFSLSKDFRLHSLFEEFDDRTYLKYLGELFLKFDDLFNRYQSELNQLQLLTERIERERARAEEVYQQALIEIERLNEMLEKKEIERDNAERVAVKYLEDIKSLEHRIGELNKKIEEIEHNRVIAEDAYSKTLKEIKDLNVLIEEKESKRLKAEEMYQNALNEVKLLQERERILNEAVERKEYERVEAEEIA